MQVTDTAFLEQFSDLVDKIIAHRHQTGRVPKEVWLKLLELSGSYLCVEILLATPDGNLMLKKRRDKTATGGEKEWEGKLHIPGLSVLLPMKTRDIIPALLSKEVVKEGNEGLVNALANFTDIWGFGRYPEPQRNTIADTVIAKTTIDPFDNRLQDDFVLVKPEWTSLDQVIDQHKPVVEAYFRGEGGFLNL